MLVGEGVGCGWGLGVFLRAWAMTFSGEVSPWSETVGSHVPLCAVAEDLPSGVVAYLCFALALLLGRALSTLELAPGGHLPELGGASRAPR